MSKASARTRAPTTPWRRRLADTALEDLADHHVLTNEPLSLFFSFSRAFQKSTVQRVQPGRERLRRVLAKSAAARGRL
jgi:fructose-bisphosphate aldolase class 1